MDISFGSHSTGWEDAKLVAETVQACVTAISIVIAGIWVLYRFGLRQERHPHIEAAAGINFIGHRRDHWIVELTCTLKNRGKVRHKMPNLNFDLNGLAIGDPLDDAPQFGGQVFFPHQLKNGSFLPAYLKSFFIDPSVSAKYSFLTQVPDTFEFLILHCGFTYEGQKHLEHVAETTVSVPRKPMT